MGFSYTAREQSPLCLKQPGMWREGENVSKLNLLLPCLSTEHQHLCVSLCVCVLERERQQKPRLFFTLLTVTQNTSLFHN